MQHSRIFLFVLVFRSAAGAFCSDQYCQQICNRMLVLWLFRKAAGAFFRVNIVKHYTTSFPLLFLLLCKGAAGAFFRVCIVTNHVISYVSVSLCFLSGPHALFSGSILQAIVQHLTLSLFLFLIGAAWAFPIDYFDE